MTSVLAYSGRRLLAAAFVVWAAFTVSFVILYALPSDPVQMMLARGGDASLDESAVQAVRHEYGFDRPVIVQYFARLGAAVTGDLGTSMQTGRSVLVSIGDALPQTLALAGLALAIAIVVALLVSWAATLAPFAVLRELALGLPPLGRAVPSFWLGLVLLQIFAFQLGWFPATGNTGWRSLVLPAVNLSVPVAVVLAQVMIQSFRSTWTAPFVEVLRAKGLRQFRIQVRHIMRHSLAPTLTVLGVVTGAMLAGSIVTETVFSRSGVGQLTQQAVTSQDLPVIQGVVVLSAVVFSVVNLAVDLVHPLIDPRVLSRPLGRRRPVAV